MYQYHVEVVICISSAPAKEHGCICIITIAQGREMEKLTHDSRNEDNDNNQQETIFGVRDTNKKSGDGEPRRVEASEA